MSEDEFTTKKYLESIELDINRNKKFFKNAGRIEGHDVDIVNCCIQCIGITKESLVRHLTGYDSNPAWKWFLTEVRPSFELHEEFVQNCFMVFSILEIIINELEILGTSSTSAHGIIRQIEAIKKLFKFDDVCLQGYHAIKEKYETREKISIVYWRAIKDFEDKNNKNIESELLKLKEQQVDLEKAIDEKLLKANEAVGDVDVKLEYVKHDASFLFLYHGFDSYGRIINRKLRFLLAEKFVWVISLVATIILGAYLRVENNWDWWYLTPFVGIVLLFFMLLKVNLRKTDQFEQIKSKVEHKVAVSAFYQNQIERAEAEGLKASMDEEYYRFIFSNIETTEWNTPDILGDITSLIKTYRG